jgi:hypothetical protein
MPVLIKLSAEELKQLTHDQLIARCLLLQAEAERDARTMGFVVNVNEQLGQHNCQLFNELQKAQASQAVHNKPVRVVLEEPSPAPKPIRVVLEEPSPKPIRVVLEEPSPAQKKIRIVVESE